MASQNEQKKTGLGDLPQELYDEIIYQVSGGFLRKGGRPILRRLMAVNKRFYNSCSRLIYRTAEMAFGKADLYIPESFQELSKSERRRFVQHVDIVNMGSSAWFDRPGRTMRVIPDIPAVLARLPALKSLHVDLEIMAPASLVLQFPSRPPDHADKVGLLHQLYPPSLQALSLHQSFAISGQFPDHTRSLNRIMPSLRHFKFDGGWLSIDSQEEQVFEPLRYAKKLETLSLVGILGDSFKCIRQLPLDNPLRRFDINEAMFPASDLLAIANFASSLEALDIHGVWIASGTWEEVLSSLCGARNITLLRGEDLGYFCDTFAGPFRNTASDDLALTRLKKQVSLNREHLGTITAYQSDDPCMSAVRRQVHCTVGETSVRW